MAYLYGVTEISLESVERRKDEIVAAGLTEAQRTAIDWEGDADERSLAQVAVEIAVNETGSASHSWLSNLMDWHELDDLYEQFDRMHEQGRIDVGSGLVSCMFEGGVLGIHPVDWGFVGFLTATDVARLRASLEQSAEVRARADHAVQVEAQGPAGPKLIDDPLAGPGRILASLRDITPGRDIAVDLG